MIRNISRPVAITRHHGFSLIEVMVALVISMLLLAALASLLMESSNSHRELAKQSQQIENGTYAMLKVGDDLKHAGFYGLFSVRSNPNPAAMPDPCVDSSFANFSAALQAAINLPVQGYNDPAASPIACINNHLANTDVLVIRRANTDVNLIVDEANGVFPDNSNRLYLQSSGTGVVINTGDQYVAGPPAAPFNLTVNTQNPPSIVTDNVNTPPRAPVFEYFTHIYYVSDCNNCSGGGDGIPTLYRAYLDANGLIRNEPLVDGIEQFQVEYGVDTDDNGVIDNYTTDPTVAGDVTATITAWRQVNAVRLYILARNIEATNFGGPLERKTYNLGNFGSFTPAANDRFKRHLFTSTFQLMSLM